MTGMEVSLSIPHKSSFKFSELPSITGVKPYVLRFWETEFEDIRPVLSEDGQKVYSRVDVETILKIKVLLFENKLSLIEAKSAIKDPHFGKVIEVEPKVSSALALETLMEALTFIKSVKQKYRW